MTEKLTRWVKPMDIDEGDRLYFQVDGRDAGIPIVAVDIVETVKVHVTLSNGCVEIFDPLDDVEIVND